MSLREKIMAVGGKDVWSVYCLDKAASIAEAREKELLAEIDRLTTMKHNNPKMGHLEAIQQKEELERVLVSLGEERKALSKKVEVYESLLHRIQLNAAVSMNVNNVHQLIKNICDWSYAHRVGNGELSDEEQNEYIQRAFDKLLEINQ